MRRLVVIGAAAVVVAPGAAAATPRTGFAFGRLGGNIRPFTITISTAGGVRGAGAAPAHRRRLTQQQLANMNRVAFDVDFENLPLATMCRRTLPDVAAMFIRVGDRTVRVHGDCVARFDRLWTALSRATRAR